MCDRAFPDRDGWFSDFYAESCTWIATPPWFRNWVEHEQRAASLRIWQLGVLSGLLQTEDYARAILAVNPGVTDDQVTARLAARLARQAPTNPGRAARRVVPGRRGRATPLRRIAEVMTAQLAHLAGVARLPNVTIQVVRTSSTPASSAASPSPSAPHMWKPLSPVRCSRTAKSLTTCSPASIRSGTKRSESRRR